MATEDLDSDWLTQARSLALGLPEAVEKETWGHPTFRVRDKIFATIGAGEGSTEFVPPDGSAPRGDVVTAMTMKAAAGEHESLLAQGSPFFKPKYVGSRGWIGIVISDETDWAEVEELVIDSYLTIAPKTLAKKLIATFDA